MMERVKERDQIEAEPRSEGRVPAQPGEAHGSRARGLLAIGLFKLSKAVFFIAVGFGALHLIHSDVGNLLLRATSMLHLDPTGRFVEMLQDKADLLSGHKLRQVGMFTFLYAAVSLVEGVGLMMEKTWAEYLTLTLTIAALPWDVTEVIREPTAMRASLVAINLAVLAYLLWFIRMHRREMREAAGGHGRQAPVSP